MIELISCIMPTRDRREFVPAAIRCFMQQDYPNRELIIVADGERIDDLVPPGATNIHLLPLWPGAAQVSVGLKLNLGIQAAHGDVIAILNDDDWHASWRLGYQYEALVTSQARICGTDRITYLDLPRGEVWRYEYSPQPSKTYLLGGTMMFRREYWQKRPFMDRSVGEDNAFIDGRGIDPDGRSRGMLNVDDDSFYVGTIHEHNASPKELGLRQLSDNWQCSGKKMPTYVDQWWLDVVQSIGRKANDD